VEATKPLRSENQDDIKSLQSQSLPVAVLRGRAAMRPNYRRCETRYRRLLDKDQTSAGSTCEEADLSTLPAVVGFACEKLDGFL
jgi:hypothetical protein